jgi:formamidopyrimidine-DNA glycosylase
VDVRRRAKVLLIDLSTDYTVVVHLKMTGQLVYIAPIASKTSRHAHSRHEKSANNSLQAAELSRGFKQSSLGQESLADFSEFARNAVEVSDAIGDSEVRFGAGHPNDSLVGELPDRSTRVSVEFSDGSHLYFNDQRKFGWMKLHPSAEVPNMEFMQKVGPEPLEQNFTHKEFIPRVRRRNGTSIKAAILDQTVLAGVGNIYADESLWGAKIHPATRVKEVSDAQLKTLLHEIKYVMNLSIEKGGSTDKNYVNAEGKKGSYIDFARVFRQEGKLCPRCGTTIEKLRVAGRGTHICPDCQKVV